jgi:hypothetical protein
MYFGFDKLAWIIVAYGSWIYNYTNAITTDPHFSYCIGLKLNERNNKTIQKTSRLIEIIAITLI